MRQENYTDSLLSANGDIFNAKGDIFQATGDIFNSRGDVFPATGDILNAKGDILNANGDFFNADGPTGAPGSDEWLDYYKTHPFDNTYYNWLDGETSQDQPTQKTSLLDKLSQLVGIADQGADVYNKLKKGTTVEDSAYSADVQLGTEQPEKKDYKIWYIAGGVVVFLVVAGVILTRKKK